MTDLIVAALATWQIVEIWHHSFLLATPRSIAEMWPNKLGELLSCPWCLSVWVGAACTLGLQVPGSCGSVTAFLVWAFATSRLANLGNDVFHGYSRTPRFRLPELVADDGIDPEQAAL